MIYVRQSRHKDYDRTVSPEDQEAQCRALPAVKACAVVEVYRDLDLSGGSTRKRVGLLALLERVKSGGVAVVAALDQSRAFRNTADALTFYALMEQRPDVKVEFVKGRFDRSAVGGFTYTTLAAAHEMERRMVGEKTRDALRYMLARGDMVGPLPLGYRRASDRSVEADPETAPLVRRVFEDYATGVYSVRSLGSRLNAEGVKLPRYATGWLAVTLNTILRHPGYIGLTHTDGRNGHGELVAASWPALIPRETWDAVQGVLDRRRTGPGGRQPAQPYTFRGLLRCGRCGGRFYAHELHGVHWYHCRDGGGSVRCSSGVREDRLEPWGRSLMEWLEGAASWPNLRPAVEGFLGRTSRPPDALAQIDANLERVGQRFEWGDITAEEYHDRRERLLALKREAMTDMQPARPRIVTSGLVAAWDRDDKAIRNRLLLNLFTEIDVESGRIFGAQPRSEVAAEVSERLTAWPGLGIPVRLRFA